MNPNKNCPQKSPTLALTDPEPVFELLLRRLRNEVLQTLPMLKDHPEAINNLLYLCLHSRQTVAQTLTVLLGTLSQPRGEANKLTEALNSLAKKRLPRGCTKCFNATGDSNHCSDCGDV